MPAMLENRDVASSGNDRLKSQDTGVSVGPFLFPSLVRLAWPSKTAAELATIGDSDTRTAERWLSGKVEAPPLVYFTAVAEIIRRDRKKRALDRR